jgi:alkanesulfonate monooxygenase SsuD/methylene tetrahydromethanopterin reductase-like flavin-dependent oxidoreductase (luciferase family)
VDLYRKTALKASHGHLPLGVHSYGYIADDSQQASDEFFPSYANAMSIIGKERGWPPTIWAQFEAGRSKQGALFVGSPQQIIEKILYEKELFGLDRFLLHMSAGTMPHAQIMHSIELYGTVVASTIRK